MTANIGGRYYDKRTPQTAPELKPHLSFLHPSALCASPPYSWKGRGGYKTPPSTLDVDAAETRQLQWGTAEIPRGVRGGLTASDPQKPSGNTTAPPKTASPLNGLSRKAFVHFQLQKQLQQLWKAEMGTLNSSPCCQLLLKTSLHELTTVAQFAAC